MSAGPARTRLAKGLLGALAWVLLCLRWWDVAAPWRPVALDAVPPGILAAAFVIAAGAWLVAARPDLAGPQPEGNEVWWFVLLAVLFRLPTAWGAAAGAVTPDGALSGIVALHVRDGIDHLVFVPHVPYSGSLKSHLTAPLAALVDPARAFALASVGFYAAFVAAVYRLGAMTGNRFAARAAALYLVFSPPYVTRYSLSNDGNYVEVLALGTWALVLAARWIETPAARGTLAVLGGVLLGLGFWCHILAVIHVAAFGLLLLRVAPRDALLRSGPLAAGGFTLGYLPGLLWNAGNHWGSFRYLVPGGEDGGTPATKGLGARAFGLFTDQWPSLLGYDPGYSGTGDFVLRAVAALAVVLALVATVGAVRSELRAARPARFVLLGFALVNATVAFFALPQLPGNPRYLLFLMAPLSLFLGEWATTPVRRKALALLVAAGALASMAQWPGASAADQKWRQFVADLRAEGVRYCFTDFYLATKVNFLSEEQVVCSAKLGPTTTEYFFEYRERAEHAPEAALIAVNQTAARRMEGRLEALGVTYVRRDFMKPTLLRLSRKVDPEELFPGRSFPWR